MRQNRAPHSAETDYGKVVAHAREVLTAAREHGMLRRVNHHTSPWIVRLGRIGYSAKGVVFICVGLLSATAAVRGSARATDSRGVMQAIVQQPFGHGLLLALIAGLVCYRSCGQF
jgi:hypothetical protein